MASHGTPRITINEEKTINNMFFQFEEFQAYRAESEEHSSTDDSESTGTVPDLLTSVSPQFSSSENEVSSRAESTNAYVPEPIIPEPTIPRIPTFQLLDSTSSESSSSQKRSIPMETDANSSSAEVINNSTASNEADKSARLPRFVFPSYTNISGFSVHITVYIFGFYL